MPSSQDLSGGGHGHGQRGEENKNGSGGETVCHSTTMVPPWHRLDGTTNKQPNGQRREDERRTAKRGSEQKCQQREDDADVDS